MSFRNTFTTNFIYQASEDTWEANEAVTRIFDNWAQVLTSRVDDRGYGFYSGWFKTLSGDLQEADEELRQIIPKLERATKVPFRLTVLLESGPTITYDIRPTT